MRRTAHQEFKRAWRMGMELLFLFYFSSLLESCYVKQKVLEI